LATRLVVIVGLGLHPSRRQRLVLLVTGATLRLFDIDDVLDHLVVNIHQHLVPSQEARHHGVERCFTHLAFHEKCE
jgi:hypothetical protein